MQKQLTRRMAGEIVISEKPGDTLKKWRTIFKLSQKNLASLLNVKPSVVCDFEKREQVVCELLQGDKVVRDVEKL